MPADIYVVLHIRLGCPCPMAAAIAEDAVAFIEAVSVQATDAEKEAADIEKQVEKAAAAEPVTAESAASSAAGTEGQVAQEVADSRPASLKKSQDAAAARSQGEQIGDTGRACKAHSCTHPHVHVRL